MSSIIDRKYYETLESGKKFDPAELLMKESHNDSALIDIDKIRLYKIEEYYYEAKKKYENILKEKELNSLNFYIMGCLYNKKNLSGRSLAQKCRASRHVIYRACKKLVKLGYLEQPCDNCGMHSRLTELGVKIFLEVYEKIKRL